VLIKIVAALKAKGISVGGMISREAREGNVRVGFEIIDLTNGKHGWLAHINQKSGPQVGKYHVNLEDLEKIGATAIIDAAEKYAVVAIDEIGPMELFSQKFKQAAKLALESKKLVLAVIHAKAKDPLINQSKQREDAEIFVVTLANRNTIVEEITKRALTNMQSTYDRIQYYKIEKNQKEAIITKLKAFLASEKEVTLAWLFGSLTCRNSIRDIDLAIHSEPKLTFKDFLNLNAQIELELGMPVDMIEIGNTPQSLKENIFASGILLKGTRRLQQQLQSANV
jgi:nucleoside-triphosphatase